jgi:hypothetical protein
MTLLCYDGYFDWRILVMMIIGNPGAGKSCYVISAISTFCNEKSEAGISVNHLRCWYRTFVNCWYNCTFTPAACWTKYQKLKGIRLRNFRASMRNVRLIIWWSLHVWKKKTMQHLDKRLKEAWCAGSTFVLIVFVGDFQQFPPIYTVIYIEDVSIFCFIFSYYQHCWVGKCERHDSIGSWSRRICEYWNDVHNNTSWGLGCYQDTTIPQTVLMNGGKPVPNCFMTTWCWWKRIWID